MTQTPTRARPADVAPPTSVPADPAPASSALHLLWPVALLALGSLVTAAAWHRLSVSLLFVLVATVPMLALRGAVRIGLSRWASSTLLLLLALLGAYVMTAGAGLSLEDTVRDSVPRLLSAPLPYVPDADVLVGPLLLVALVSLLVGLRAEGRTRVAPVAGAAVLYVSGALLTSGSADPWGLVAVLLLVVALLGWVLLDEHSEPVRQRLVVAGPVSVIGVVVLAAVATLPLRAPFSPRALVDPPTVDVVTTNPLSQLGAWATNPTTPLLQVSGSSVPLRLVVLDNYDGEQWSASTSYAEVGTDGRTGLGTGPYATPSTVQVRFDGLGGSWLPSPGTPSAVGAPDALVDPGTGTLFTTDPTTALGYQVDGSYDDPPERALRSAQVRPGALYDHYTALPTLPAPLAEYASRVAADAVTPYQRAVTIASQIRHDYQFSPRAISGTALWRLQAFLLGSTKEPGGKEGTSEQFAAAFAVVARYNGLPTRVVVGFRPGEVQDDGSRLVTGSDALAWAEVYFDQLGWVPFSPTPADDTFPTRRPVKADQPDLPVAADTGSPVPTSTAPTSSAPVTGPASGSGDGTSRGLGLPAATPYVAAGGLLVLVVALLLGARALRRLRHRRRGPAGAWLEVLDALRLAGLRPLPHENAEQIADAADARLATTSASRVAAVAERAAFGPAPTPGSPPDAPDLRHDVRTVQRRARALLPRWRRWWWHLDARVLARAPKA